MVAPLKNTLYNSKQKKDQTRTITTFVVRIQVRVRFSAVLQTGPGDHPVSYTMGSVSFSGVQRLRRALTPSPYLGPRLKN